MNSVVHSECLYVTCQHPAGRCRIGRNVRDVLKAIAETVSEVIRGVNSPLVVCAMVWCCKYTVRNQIPHHRVSRLKVLLHPQDGFAWFVGSVFHFLKLGQGLLDRSCTMCAGFPRATLIASTIRIDFLSCKYISIYSL